MRSPGENGSAGRPDCLFPEHVFKNTRAIAITLAAQKGH
jgi:hypothetical protein